MIKINFNIQGSSKDHVQIAQVGLPDSEEQELHKNSGSETQS